MKGVLAEKWNVKPENAQQQDCKVPKLQNRYNICSQKIYWQTKEKSDKKKTDGYKFR